MWPQHGPCFFVDTIRDLINNVVLKAQKIKVYLSGTKLYFQLELLHQLLYNDAVSTLQAIILYQSPTSHHICRFLFSQIPLEVALLEP
jgi:hypothetical protein